MRSFRVVVGSGLLALLATTGTSAPTPEGEALRRVAGIWDATIQMAGPEGTPPLVMNGTETARLEPGGAWVVSDFRGLLEGRPFHGHAVLTFDPASGRYQRVWADSSSPAFWFSEGTYDAASGALTLWIESRDSKGQAVRWREVTSFKDENTRSFTMYLPGPETTEASGMTITYRRRSEPPPPRATQAPQPPPGPEHALLARHAGLWKATIEDRRNPAVPPETSRAVETNSLGCSGLFLLSELAGDKERAPFNGHGLLGFDPGRKKYISAWVDSIERRLVLTEGTADAATGTLTLHGTIPDGKGGSLTLRDVLEWKGADQRLFTMHLKGAEGRERPARTIQYRRVNPS